MCVRRQTAAVVVGPRVVRAPNDPELASSGVARAMPAEAVERADVAILANDRTLSPATVW
jgi:hypothetical protein